MHNIHLPLPPEWIAILAKVREITRTNPILSGGALRDHFLGKPVKDLDIFMPYSEDAVVYTHVFALTHGYCRFQNVSAYQGNMGEVHTVSGYKHPTQIELNFIFLDPTVPCTAIDVAQRNDFGICQIATDLGWISDKWVVVSETFLKDVADKTFTLCRAGHDADRSLRRWDRLSVKYPEYVLTSPIPYGNERLTYALSV